MHKQPLLTQLRKSKHNDLKCSKLFDCKNDHYKYFSSTQRQQTVASELQTSTISQIGPFATNLVTFSALLAMTWSVGKFLQLEQRKIAYFTPGVNLETLTLSSNSTASSSKLTFGSLFSYKLTLTGKKNSSQSMIPFTAIPQSTCFGMAKSRFFPLPYMLLLSQILPKGVRVQFSSNRSAQMRTSLSLYCSQLVEQTPTARQIWSQLASFSSGAQPVMITGYPLRMFDFIHCRQFLYCGCGDWLSQDQQMKPSLARVCSAFWPTRTQEPAAFRMGSQLRQLPQQSPQDWIEVSPQNPWPFSHWRRAGISRSTVCGFLRRAVKSYIRLDDQFMKLI